MRQLDDGHVHVKTAWDGLYVRQCSAMPLSARGQRPTPDCPMHHRLVQITDPEAGVITNRGMCNAAS